MIYAVNLKTKEHRIHTPGYPSSQDEEFVEATPDGWIEWPGGECPLPNEQPCEAKTHTGEQQRFKKAGAIIGWKKAIAHYRPILDADTKSEPPAWDGESWPPPVGSIVESFASQDNGTQAEVLAVRQGHVIGCHAESGVAGWLLKDQCRPIRSEEDRAVEEMRAVIDACDAQSDAQSVDERLHALYRAICDSKIPGVTLEETS